MAQQPVNRRRGDWGSIIHSIVITGLDPVIHVNGRNKSVPDED